MELDFEKENGLIPAIVQDHANGEVLMLGFMNREALAKTQETGFVTFYSRSRKKLWTKGETSGQKLLLRELRVDCDRDALLVQRGTRRRRRLPRRLPQLLLPPHRARTAKPRWWPSAFSRPKNFTAKGNK